MRLYRKLLLYTLAAAVLPLTAVGFHLLATAEGTLRRRIQAQQITAARSAAELVGRDLDALFQDVRQLVETWQPGRLAPEELRGFLRVVVRSSPRVRASLLLDGKGKLLVDPVAAPGTETGRPLSPAGLESFRLAVPEDVALAAEGELVVAPARRGPEEDSRLVVALAVAGSGSTWVLGVLADLEDLRGRLEAAAGEPGAAALLDQDARVVIASSRARFSGADLEAAQRLRAAGQHGGVGEIPGEAGGHLAAWAPVPGDLGWSVFVRVPAARAFAEVVAMRREVLAATLLTLAALLGLGALFVRGITRGLGRIDAAAREIGRGNLAVRLPAEGSDEVAEVSRAFNQMGEEVQAARARLERWNQELQALVEERTLELKEAQARLLESQKLAAIGQLGAGVAHEINNPLTGILGQAQLLLERLPPHHPDAATLRQIEQLARRSRDITLNLLRFSQQREEPELASLDINLVVRDALLLAERHIRDEGIELSVGLADGEPLVRGDAGQLAHVLVNLLANARVACRGRPGPHIAVETAAANGEVRLTVRDNGKGITPEVRPRIFEPFFTTKDVWSNVGLGLSVSWRIVAAHGGRIEVESRAGEGSAFTVVLPAAV